MRVAIVGAGAMGCTYGGLLVRDGHEVWLIDVWQEQAEAIQRNSLRLDGPDGPMITPPG